MIPEISVRLARLELGSGEFSNENRSDRGLGRRARRLADRARAMALAGAFMHWFEAQGITRDDVLEAADAVEDLAEGYLAWYY